MGIFLSTFPVNEFETYVLPALADPDAAKYLSGVGLQYGGVGMIKAIKQMHPTLKTWETETPCGGGRAHDCGTGYVTTTNALLFGSTICIALALSLFGSLAHTHTLSLSLSHTHTNTHTHTLTPPLSLSRSLCCWTCLCTFVLYDSYCMTRIVCFVLLLDCLCTYASYCCWTACARTFVGQVHGTTAGDGAKVSIILH